jgi:hypothetical protein
MEHVTLLRRVEEACPPTPATALHTRPLWPIDGQMHPNNCPAIRDANRLGLMLGALHDVALDGPDDFDVRVGMNASGSLLVTPGVIGSPDSSILFAKIDTGLSVDDLPFDWLALPVLNLEHSKGLIVPSVLYPKGYCGPLFIAVAARHKVTVGAGYPLTQLVPLDGREVSFQLSATLGASKRDDAFEGLLTPGWKEILRTGKNTKARRCLQVFMQYPEAEVIQAL